MPTFFYSEEQAEKIIEYYLPLLCGKQVPGIPVPIVELYKRDFKDGQYRVYVRASVRKGVNIQWPLEPVASRFSLLDPEVYLSKLAR